MKTEQQQQQKSKNKTTSTTTTTTTTATTTSAVAIRTLVYKSDSCVWIIKEEQRLTETKVSLLPLIQGAQTKNQPIIDGQKGCNEHAGYTPNLEEAM